MKFKKYCHYCELELMDYDEGVFDGSHWICFECFGKCEFCGTEDKLPNEDLCDGCKMHLYQMEMNDEMLEEMFKEMMNDELF